MNAFQVTKWYVLLFKGLRPRRTLRAVLWTAEEQGGVGAQQYFNLHKVLQLQKRRKNSRRALKKIQFVLKESSKGQRIVKALCMSVEMCFQQTGEHLATSQVFVCSNLHVHFSSFRALAAHQALKPDKLNT